MIKPNDKIIKEINFYFIPMSHNHNLDEELPCGGYPEEDKAIQKNMKILSEETS